MTDNYQPPGQYDLSQMQAAAYQRGLAVALEMGAAIRQQMRGMMLTPTQRQELESVLHDYLGGTPR